MDNDDTSDLWGGDATVLGELGQQLFAQDLKVSVRISQQLAEAAVAAWRRDDGDAVDGDESSTRRRMRHAAGTLAVIGLSIEEGGHVDGDDVVVNLDAWYVGGALDAAEEVGLLR